MRTPACKTSWDFHSCFSYTDNQKDCWNLSQKYMREKKAFGKASDSFTHIAKGIKLRRCFVLCVNTVCLFLLLIRNIILNPKTFLTKVSTTDIDFLEKFWFRWNSIFWWKTFNWEVPIQLLFWHLLQALQVCRQWIRKKQWGKYFILSLILFKLQKTVTYDSNYIFGIILNDKP